MATKKTGYVKTQKETNFAQAEKNTAPQNKVPFISARITRLSDSPESKIKANASVTIGNHFAVHGIKVYDGGEKGMQVLYPATKGSDGQYHENFHPVTKEAREAINGYVLDAYKQKLEQNQSEDETQSEDLDEDEEPVFEQTM